MPDATSCRFARGLHCLPPWRKSSSNHFRPRSSDYQSATVRRWRSQVRVLSWTPVSQPLCLSSHRSGFVNRHSSVRVRPEAPFKCKTGNAECGINRTSFSRSAFRTPRCALISGTWCNSSISPCEGDGPGANPGFLTIERARRTAPLTDSSSRRSACSRRRRC